MFKFVIALDDDFDHRDLAEAIGKFHNCRIRDFDHKVFVTGSAKYGTFCSILWQCQKFGAVVCELRKE